MSDLEFTPNIEIESEKILIGIEAAAKDFGRKQVLKWMKDRDGHQAQCTHMKGGVVTPNDQSVVMNGHGTDSSDYAIARHILPNGETMVLCLRCLKEWHPIDPFFGTPATPGWAEAMKFPTTNKTSGSTTFDFSWKDKLERAHATSRSLRQEITRLEEQLVSANKFIQTEKQKPKWTRLREAIVNLFTSAEIISQEDTDEI